MPLGCGSSLPCSKSICPGLGQGSVQLCLKHFLGVQIHLPPKHSESLKNSYLLLLIRLEDPEDGSGRGSGGISDSLGVQCQVSPKVSVLFHSTWSHLAVLSAFSLKRQGLHHVPPCHLSGRTSVNGGRNPIRRKGKTSPALRPSDGLKLTSWTPLTHQAPGLTCLGVPTTLRR